MIQVVITPTYSGCPAMREIKSDINKVLRKHGYQNVIVSSQLSPAWTTDWITQEGAKKLKQYGIAPPLKSHEQTEHKRVACPQCDSLESELISEFGSTACKSLYKCNACLEPFDYFKCI